LNDGSRLVGLVTTNATIYDSSPPQFTDGALRYQVAGLHFLPDGSLTQGTYDLLLRSDAARCIYGFSDVPVTAEVSVTSEDGIEQVATTSVSEQDGWLKMSAYGFGFSKPTISVRISSTEEQAKKIVCKRGKKRKVVTGSPARCPTGWSKLAGDEVLTLKCVKKKSDVKGPRKLRVVGTEIVLPRCPKGYRTR